MEEKKKPGLILLIDDDAGINYINKRLLELRSFGEEIVTVNSAKDGLEFIQKSYQTNTAVPDLILLDLMMPLMNGFQFLEEFDKLPEEVKSQCKVIVVSSTEMDEDLKKIKQNSNVLTFFGKPLSLKDLEYLKNYFQ